MTKRRALGWGGAVVAGLLLIGLLWRGKATVPVAVPGTAAGRLTPQLFHHLPRIAETTAPIAPPRTPSSETNAAQFYRDAMAQFNALSPTNKDLLSNWQTNVDAAVEAELCAQLRPICDLLHQAAPVTNCDWGLGPLEVSTPLPHLGTARALGRAAIWSAAHCRRNDATAATADVLATLRLGQQVGHGAALVGYLVDMSLQQAAWTYVAANLDQFHGPAGRQLAAAFDDLADDDAFSRALGGEADFMERFATKLTTLPPAEAANQVQDFVRTSGKADVATVVAGIQQVASLNRELAQVMATGSEAAYATWQRHVAELQTANTLLVDILPYGMLVEKAQSYEVNRALVAAGLAVAANGPAGLTAHLDPSTGQPFTYQAVPGGFELQSNYPVNNQPLKMFFSQSASPQEKP